MRWLLTLTKFFIGCFLFLAVKKFCHNETAGFQIERIRSHLTPTANWHIPGSAEEDERIAQLLSQPFTYLNSGGQSYAFISEDKKIVLKFFKMHHMTSLRWLKSLPFPGLLDRYRLKILFSHEKKLNRIFDSCHLAFSDLKKETGLIAMQLNPQENSHLSVRLCDKLNIWHIVDLSEIPFALQYYAENPFDVLRKHLKDRDIAAAKSIVKEMVDCLIERYDRGIIDKDPALRRNMGLLGDQAIFIDIGSFCASSEEKSIHLQLYHETRRMDKWLKQRSPELKGYLDTLIAEASAP